MFGWKFRWLLFMIVGQPHEYYVSATWPLANSSSLQLLGLFPDDLNASDSTSLFVHCRAMFKAAVLLSHQYNITIGEQLIGWQSAQTSGEPIDALGSSCQAIAVSPIVGIVGPAYSREAPIIADLGEKVGIPVISYSATAPDLSDRNLYPDFYRTVPSDNAAALAVVQLFIRFNWTSCIIIYQNDAFGTGGANAINDALTNNGLGVAQTMLFDLATQSFHEDLDDTLTSSSTRIVVLWASSTITQLILQMAIDADVLGPQFIWILSTSIPFNAFNEIYDTQLIGLLTVEPIIAAAVDASFNLTLLNAAYDIWKQYEPETFPGPSKVSNYALFTFDATWLLIQSLQQLCSNSPNSFSTCISFTDPSFCIDRRFLNSERFFDIINKQSFLGVSGPVQFSTNVTDRINGSYYLSQNAQIASDGIEFVPVLDYSDHGGWQRYPGAGMIVWPGSSLAIPVSGAKLNGTRLRIGVIQSAPYTMLTTTTDQFGTSTTALTGYIPDLLNFLQAKIGFIPDIQLVPANLTYPQALQAVVAGVYDIVVGDVMATSDRKKIVDFSASIYDSSLYIIMRTDAEVYVDLLSFLKPFSRNLWLLILGVTIYGGILFGILEREENDQLQNRSISSLFVMSIWYCFGNLAGYGAGFDARTAAGRLLTAGFYILSLVLVISYTANLVSNLTLAKTKDIISGLDDIKSGKIALNRIGIRVGSASEDFYLREISNGLKNYYPLRTKQDTYDCLLNRTIDISFIDIGVGEYITNNIYCNLTLVGEAFDNGIMGIVAPKGWIYLQDLDMNVLSLRESGNLDDLKLKWMETVNCPDSSDTSTALQIESMTGLFLVFAAISILSLFLFVWTNRYIVKNYFEDILGRKNSTSKNKNNP